MAAADSCRWAIRSHVALSVCASVDLRLHARRHNVEVLCIASLAYNEGIRLGRLAVLQLGQLDCKVVKKRMILKLDVDLGLSGGLLKVFDHFQMRLHAFIGGARGQQKDGTEERRHMSLPF